jgi:hypothetical protein
VGVGEALVVGTVEVAGTLVVGALEVAGILVVVGWITEVIVVGGSKVETAVEVTGTVESVEAVADSEAAGAEITALAALSTTARETKFQENIMMNERFTKSSGDLERG